MADIGDLLVQYYIDVIKHSAFQNIHKLYNLRK